MNQQYVFLLYILIDTLEDTWVNKIVGLQEQEHSQDK